MSANEPKRTSRLKNARGKPNQFRGEILNSLQCKKRRLMPPRPPSLTVVHAALKTSTCQPFAKRGGAMRADFEMTSGLFQARPVSLRLTARVTYHTAAASMPAARHQRGRIEAAWCQAIPCP